MRHFIVNLLLLACVYAHGEPSIVSVEPSQGELGLSSEVMITGLSTQFAITELWSGTIRWKSNIESLYLHKAQDTLNSVQWRFGDSTHVYATFAIAATNDTGNYDLTVLQKVPHIAVELKPAYRLVAPPPPSIQSINPDTGIQGIPLIVTIAGNDAHFGINQSTTAPVWQNNVDSVYLQSQSSTLQATSFVPTSADTLKACFNPSLDATTGQYDLVVVQHSPNSRMVLAQKLQIIPYGVPALVSTSPGSFGTGQSFSLSIAGSSTSFGLPEVRSDGKVYWDNNVDSVLLLSGNHIISAQIWVPDNLTNMSAKFVTTSDDPNGEYDLIVVQHEPRERMKLSASVHLVRPELMRIDPDSGYQGQLCSVTIIGLNTQFGNPEQNSPTMGNVASVFLRNAADSMRAGSWYAFGPGADTAFPAIFAPGYDNSPGVYDLVVVERDPPLQIELPDAFRLLAGTTPAITLSPDYGMSGDTIDCVITGSFYAPQIDSVVLVAPGFTSKAISRYIASPLQVIVTFPLPEVTEEKSFEVQMYHDMRAVPMTNKNGFRISPVLNPSVTIKQDGCASPGNTLNMTILSSDIALAAPYPVEDFGGVDWVARSGMKILIGDESISPFSIECTSASECSCSGKVPVMVTTGWYPVNIQIGKSEMVSGNDSSVYIASVDSCERTAVISASVSSMKHPVVSRTHYGYHLNLSSLPEGTVVRLFDIKGRTIDRYTSSAGAGSVMIHQKSGCFLLSITTGQNREITKLAFP